MHKVSIFFTFATILFINAFSMPETHYPMGAVLYDNVNREKATAAITIPG